MIADPPTWTLRLNNVSYSYPNGTMALDGVSLEIERGEIISIIGPSGSGKSTLLAAIAGLLAPSRGEVLWNDAAGARSDRLVQRRLTLVFQKDTLLPWLTVSKNVAFGLRYLRLDRKTKQERVERLLELAGLQDASSLYPYQLSGGMRRRVAFLSGVAPFPQVLLLDEPFSALDEPSRLGIHRDVLAIAHDLGMTMILVTHDLGEAISLADRVYILSRRPARVTAVHSVPFGHDRDVFTLRETVEYQSLYRSLWHDLRLQIARSDSEKAS